MSISQAAQHRQNNQNALKQGRWCNFDLTSIVCQARFATVQVCMRQYATIHSTVLGLAMFMPSLVTLVLSAYKMRECMRVHNTPHELAHESE